MHRVAESGIAAHWKYKAGERRRLDAAGARARVALEPGRAAGGRQLRGVPRERQGRPVPRQGLRVHAARATILRLPSGATVVDFAYAVHTDIGNRCVAAKVDRRLTPLRTVLRNGQTVEIITAKGAMPNPSWVNFVVTAKARSAIRHYLKSLRRTRSHRARPAAARPGARRIQAVARGRERRSRCSAALGELGMKDLDELLREDRPGRAPRAAGRAAPAARRATRGRRHRRARAAGHRRHRRPARHLRALLLPDPVRSDLRLPVRAAAAS